MKKKLQLFGTGFNYIIFWSSMSSMMILPVYIVVTEDYANNLKLTELRIESKSLAIM